MQECLLNRALGILVAHFSQLAAAHGLEASYGVTGLHGGGLFCAFHCMVADGINCFIAGGDLDDLIAAC